MAIFQYKKLNIFCILEDERRSELIKKLEKQEVEQLKENGVKQVSYNEFWSLSNKKELK